MSDIVINKADRNLNDINMILIENANNKTNKKEIKIKGNLMKKISNEKKENSENKIVKEGTVLKIPESFWETKNVNNKICRSLNINKCEFENPINGNYTIKYLTFIFCKTETLPPKIRSKPTLNENDSKKLDNIEDRNQKKVYNNSKLPARFLKKKRISKINNEILNDNNISYKIIEQKEDMFLLSKTNNTKKIMKNSKEKDKKEIIMKKKDINSSNNKKELIKKLPNTLKIKNKTNINSNLIKKKIKQIPNIPSANCITKPTVSDNSNPTFTNQINYNLKESIYDTVYGLIIDEKINRKKDIIENKISNSYVENLCDSDDETRKLDNTKSVIIDYKFDQFNHLSIEVSQHDINTLEEKNLLNDTIITFYLKFIENYFTQNCEKLVYCYNTHFCVYLQNEYKEDIEESLLNYKKLDKWGKYINIFDYEYIALPINEFNHWSLVIISNPGNIKKVFDDVSCRGINNKHYEPPKIIFLDSFFRDNENCVKVVKRFLIMEYRRKELNMYNVPNIALIKEVESRIKMIFPKVPIQNNTYDCGIYVLTFAELFLKNPKFVMSRLNEKAENENDIQNWFQSQFIQDKREFIKKLIYFLSVNCNFSLYDEYMNNNKQLFHNEYNSSHKNNFNYGNSNSQSATLKGK